MAGKRKENDEWYYHLHQVINGRERERDKEGKNEKEKEEIEKERKMESEVIKLSLFATCSYIKSRVMMIHTHFLSLFLLSLKMSEEKKFSIQTKILAFFG